MMEMNLHCIMLYLIITGVDRDEDESVAIVAGERIGCVGLPS